LATLEAMQRELSFIALLEAACTAAALADSSESSIAMHERITARDEGSDEEDSPNPAAEQRLVHAQVVALYNCGKCRTKNKE
jgi:hypothetical protein